MSTPTLAPRSRKKESLDDNEMTGASAGGLPPPLVKMSRGGAACLRQDGIFTRRHRTDKSYTPILNQNKFNRRATLQGRLPSFGTTLDFLKRPRVCDKSISIYVHAKSRGYKLHGFYSSLCWRRVGC